MINSDRRGVGYNVVPKQLYQGLLAGTSATLYTAPTGATPQAQRTRITEIVIANTHNAALAVTLYVVPSGGSAGDSTTILPAVSIAANTTWREPFSTIIETGGTLRGFAGTADKICLTVSGEDLV